MSSLLSVAQAIIHTAMKSERTNGRSGAAPGGRSSSRQGHSPPKAEPVRQQRLPATKAVSSPDNRVPAAWMSASRLRFPLRLARGSMRTCALSFFFARRTCVVSRIRRLGQDPSRQLLDVVRTPVLGPCPSASFQRSTEACAVHKRPGRACDQCSHKMVLKQQRQCCI